MKFKYKIEYDWCYKGNSGSFEIVAEDYWSAKKIGEEQVRKIEEKFGGYLVDLQPSIADDRLKDKEVTNG